MFYSENYLERSKKLDANIDEYLKESRERAAADREAAIQSKRDALFEGAAYGVSSAYYRDKVRQKNLTESVTYLEKTTKMALTEAVSCIVERSLLLDEYEYEKLNSSFREEIRETVSNLLDTVTEGFDITGDAMVTIFETLATKIPVANSGYSLDEAVTLVEARVKEAMSGDGGPDVNAAIDDLSGNVKKRVARIVKKDKKAVADAEADVQEVAPPPAPEEAPMDPNAIPPEEGMDPNMDPNAMPPEGEMPPEEGMDPNADPNAMPPEGEMPPEEGMDPNTMPPEGGAPMGGGKSIHINPDGTTSVQTPTTQFQLNSDGSMDIQISESRKFFSEPRPTGILEVLAFNEAKDMISEGKEYSADLALANAIKYITILETLDETGIIPMKRDHYEKIIASVNGVALKEYQSFGTTIQPPHIPEKTKDPIFKKTSTKSQDKKEKEKVKHKKETVKKLLEDCGYSFEVDDFEDAARAEGFIRCSDGTYER